MIIGIPKEIKSQEFRVGLTPGAVRSLCAQGHRILVESQAGVGAGFDDSQYQGTNVEILDHAQAIYDRSDLIVKVKEPQATEYGLLRPNQLLFTYLHLAAEPDLANVLCRSFVQAIAYETVQNPDGSLPLLRPMSEVAGRMSVQVGAGLLEKPKGGGGILLGGVPGVLPGHVVILGGGTAGTAALQIALGMRANVTVLDRSMKRLAELDLIFGGRCRTVYATTSTIANTVASADLLIGSVLVPGASAPKLVSREMVASMRPGSVIVDIAIDQGGCIATSRPTTHADPTFIEEGVIHYCVTNMPGAVPRTSTFALSNVTLPYVETIAKHGWIEAANRDPSLAAGLNVSEGNLVHAKVASELACFNALPPGPEA